MPTLDELLHAASRTFAIGIDSLPDPLREEVRVAYLLLRVSDYLEDNVSMSPTRKAQLLEVWGDVLAGRARLATLEEAVADAPEDTPDALVARNVRQVHDALRALGRREARWILSNHVRSSTLGMARWTLRGPALHDEADLDDYMHEVAGRVGWLLTELFALDVEEVDLNKEEMMRRGREFGLGLQTVNVIRGLHSDWERGWIYLPKSFLEGTGRRAEEIFRGEARDPRAERVVLDLLVQKAERHLDSARRYILGIPRSRIGIRLFCLLPYFFALRTLALSRGNPAVFREEVKIGRREVRRIAAAARWLCWSDAWIGWYGRRLARA